jgi:hypothetical protein
MKPFLTLAMVLGFLCLNISHSSAQEEFVTFYNSMLIPPTVKSPDYFLRADSIFHNFDPSTPGSPLNTLIRAFAFNG